jgi:D-aminoacyl-tRNA deacylase
MSCSVVSVAGVKAILQRVSAASVSVAGDTVGELTLTDGAQGLVALIGVTHDDTEAQAATLAEKIWRLRILDGERSAADAGAPILVISQFTLYANTAKGRRPSWNAAAPGPVAEPLVEKVISELRALGADVETGRFGAHMHVALVNDGPVTISLEV